MTANYAIIIRTGEALPDGITQTDVIPLTDADFTAITAIIHKPLPPTTPPPPVPRRIRVTNPEGMTLRSGPGTDYTAIGYVASQHVSEVMDEKVVAAGEIWIQLVTPRGWIARMFNGNEKAVYI